MAWGLAVVLVLALVPLSALAQTAAAGASAVSILSEEPEATATPTEEAPPDPTATPTEEALPEPTATPTEEPDVEPTPTATPEGGVTPEPTEVPDALKVEFAGRIEALPASGLLGQWTVAGQTFTVDGATRIKIEGDDEVVEVGDWAEVKALRQADGSLLAFWIAVRPPYVTLRGPISEIPEGGLGIWVIAGQPVLVDEESRLSERARQAEVGAWAEALCRQMEDGQLWAQRLLVMHANHLVRVVGIIEEMGETSWVVSGVTVMLDAETRIVGTPAVGALADVHGAMDETHAFVADLIIVRGTPNRPKPQKFVNFEGLIESMPEGRIGNWVIAGRTVEVTSATQIDESKAPAEVGAPVVVRAVEREDGSLLALTICVKRLEGVQVQVVFTGTIGSMTPPPGLWEIGGRQVWVSASTKINTRQGQATVGAMVRVKALERSGQPLWGLEITVLRPHGGPRPSPTPRVRTEGGAVGPAGGSSTPTPGGSQPGGGQGNSGKPKPTPKPPNPNKPTPPAQGRGTQPRGR